MTKIKNIENLDMVLEERTDSRPARHPVPEGVGICGPSNAPSAGDPRRTR